MESVRRAGIAALSTIAIGSLAVMGPSSAGAETLDTELTCTYKLHEPARKVSGTCSGSSPFGCTSGSFDGKLRLNGKSKGKISLSSDQGSFDGWYSGGSFDGGKAKGFFSVTLGTLQLSGGFIAILG